MNAPVAVAAKCAAVETFSIARPDIVSLHMLSRTSRRIHDSPLLMSCANAEFHAIVFIAKWKRKTSVQERSV